MQETQGTKKSNKGKNIFSAITIAFSVAVLVYLLQTEDGVRSLRHIFFHLRPAWLAWIGAGVVAGWLLEATVLHLFCIHLKKDWTFGQSFYVGMAGLFYSAITPFSAGEPMEVYYMTRMKMDTGTASSIIAIKSLVHHAVTFFYAFILVAFELNYFQTKVSNFSFVALFGLFTNSLFIIFVFLMMTNEKMTNSILEFVVRVMNRLRMQKWSNKIYDSVHSELQKFHQSSRKMGKSASLYFWTIFLTLVQITIASLISYFVYRSFNLKGEPVFIMVAADTFVTMAASFVPLPGSTGGAEGGFYLFFHEFFGETIVPAIALWRIATFYLNIVFGGIFTFWGGRRYRFLSTQSAEINEQSTSTCSTENPELPQETKEEM